MAMSHFEQFEYFEKQSDIKVHNDYREVMTATKASYEIFKKELALLE